MAGGGTGGHVLPALAVARELRTRGHRVLFIGVRRGIEAKLVPAEDFPIEWIEIGGLNRVGWRQMVATLGELPFSVWQASRILERAAPAALFSAMLDAERAMSVGPSLTFVIVMVKGFSVVRPP